MLAVLRVPKGVKVSNVQETHEGRIWNDYSDFGIFDQTNFTRYTRNLIIGRIDSLETDEYFTLISNNQFMKFGFPLLVTLFSTDVSSIHKMDQIAEIMQEKMLKKGIFMVFPKEKPKNQPYELLILMDLTNTLSKNSTPKLPYIMEFHNFPDHFTYPSF